MSQQGINVLEFTDSFEFWIRAVEDTTYGDSGFVLILNTHTNKQYYVAPTGIFINSATSASIYADVAVGQIICSLTITILAKTDGNHISYSIMNGDHVVEQIPLTKCKAGGYMKIIGKPDAVHSGV